jgi:hypothetical protein
MTTTIPVSSDLWFSVVCANNTLTFTNPTTNISGDLNVFSGNAIVNPSNYNQIRGTVNLNTTGQSQLSSLETGLSTMTTNVNLDGVVLGQDLPSLSSDSYQYTTPCTLNGTLNISGTSSDFFYIIISSTFTITDNSQITFDIGVDTNKIFWYISSTLSIGSNTTLAGTFVTPSDITPTGSTGLVGRALSSSGNVTIPSGDLNNNNCIYEGTKILMYDPIENKEFERNIEDLKIGDLIVVNGRIIEEKKFIQCKNKYVKLEFIYGGHEGQSPVCVKKGTLNKFYPEIYKDKDYPAEDLYISINHGFLIPTKKESIYCELIRATNYVGYMRYNNDSSSEKIVNIKLIEDQEKHIFIDYEKRLKIYHLGFNGHFGIYTNGLLTESFQSNW